MFISASTRKVEIKSSFQLGKQHMLPWHPHPTYKHLELTESEEDTVRTFEVIFREVIFEWYNLHATRS